MRRHEQNRNQTRTRMFGTTNPGEQSFDNDYSRDDVPESDWKRNGYHLSAGNRVMNEDRDGSYELSRSTTSRQNDPRPQGGDDLFRNNEYYTRESDQRERKNARLGLGRTNYRAGWTGHEGTGHYGKGPKGYRRSDDRVSEDVSEALYCDLTIDATQIEIEVSDGTVVLKGTVESRLMKKAAEACIEYLIGVEDVRNELKISKSHIAH